MQTKRRTPNGHRFAAAGGRGLVAALGVALWMLMSAAPAAAQLFSENEMILAIRNGTLEEVEQQFLAGFSANERSARGETALIEAVRAGRRPVVALMLERGARVNIAATRSGLTALEEAIRTNRPDFVEMLIEAGADVDKAGTGGETPIMIAAKQGQTIIVETLIAADAYLNDTDSTGRTPLMLARERRHRDTVALLEAAGAE